MICPEKIFVSLRKLRDISFWVCPEKKFWWPAPPPPPPPRSPTILGRNINVQFACSGKLYCAPKQDSAHTPMNFSLNFSTFAPRFLPDAAYVASHISPYIFCLSQCLYTIIMNKFIYPERIK